MGCEIWLTAFWPTLAVLVVATLRNDRVDEGTVVFVFLLEILWMIVLGYIAKALSNSSDEETKLTNVKDAKAKEIDYQKMNEVKTTVKSSEYLDEEAIKRYKTAQIKKLKGKEELERKKKEWAKANENVNEFISKRSRLETCKDKPIWTSKKKYLNQVHEETEQLRIKTKEEIKKKYEIEADLKKLENNISTSKYKVEGTEGKDKVDALAKAFSRLRTVCHIEGTPDINELAVTASCLCRDLTDFEYQYEPYSINIFGNRFYFFSEEIMVFSNENELVGIFDKNALKCEVETTKTRYWGYEKEPTVYEDTEIIEDDVEGRSWLHTCKDGTPDLRYKYNPCSTYYTKEKFYLKCLLKLEICGWKINYNVSSHKICEYIENTIEYYKEKEEIL